MSTGTFILPHLVLTSCHCVVGGKIGDITVYNQLGEYSEIELKAQGGVNRVDQKSDLALIELVHPIGPKGYVPVLTQQVQKVLKYPHASKGYIATNFSHDPMREDLGLYDIELNYAFTLASRNENPNRMPEDYFTCDFQLGPGHSGSPIIDDSGLIITVLSGTSTHESYEEIVANQGRINENSDAYYYAPSQQKFPEFMSWAME